MGRKVLLVGREVSEGLFGGQRRVRSPSRWAGRGREAYLEVQNANTELRVGVRRLPEGLVGPPGRPGWVGSPTRSSGRDREDYPEVWEGSGVPSECPGGIRRPTRRTWRGRVANPEVWEDRWEVPEDHPEVREGSGVPVGGLVGVGRPCWRSGRPTRWSGRSHEAHPEVWDRSGGPP